MSRRILSKSQTHRNPFTFTIDTRILGGVRTDSDSYELPISGALSAHVDWGDGSVSHIINGTQSSIKHVYATQGVYEIKINGIIQGWSHSVKNTDARKILNISKWGVFAITNTGTFNGCINLTCDAVDAPEILTNSLESTFFNCSKYNNPMLLWDFSSVTDTNQLFRSAEAFNHDLNHLDFSNVTNMSSMFRFAKSFNKLLPSHTPSLTRINAMLADNSNAFLGTLGNINIASVTDMLNLLNNSQLTTSAYNDTLIKWLDQSPKTGVTANFGSSKYTLGGAAAAARASLISTYGWTITDGGGI